MSSNSVKFTCTALSGKNKQGIIKPDENGYYEMVVGALDIYNSAGQFYVFEQAKELFNSSSQLMRRVARGTLKGEYGHPKLQPGMSNEQFANRVLTIDEQSTCCHHKEIRLDFDNVKDSAGKPIIAIISKVCPSGPNGPALEKSLNNPNENVCFSIRAFTDDYREGMVTKRVLKTIVTWDFVTEPGISVAEKYKSPTLESFGNEESKIISKNEFERGMKNINSMGMARESVILTAEELWKNMNWNPVSKPHFLNW